MSNVAIDDELKQDIFNKFDSLAKLRGSPNKELDQSFVDKETSLKRALIVDFTEYNNKWIVLLGDMDLVALSIGLISKPRDLAILDIDKRVPEITFAMKFKHKIKPARFVNHDLRIRMLAVLKNQYDFIFTESPMTLEGNEVYLSRAVQCSKKNGDSRIILSSDLENKDKLHTLFDTMHLEIEKEFKDFNHYEEKTVIDKNTSDLYILRVSEKSEPTIKNHYFGPMYFREIVNEIKPYRCKCGKIIETGKGTNYKDVNELKVKGCPYCGYNGEFVYNSSVKLE